MNKINKKIKKENICECGHELQKKPRYQREKTLKFNSKAPRTKEDSNQRFLSHLSVPE